MQGEKKYIGTKIVSAIEMSRKEFENTQDRPAPNKEDEPGYMVQYEDGYRSWSPKETFDRAYREITRDEKDLISALSFIDIPG